MNASKPSTRATRRRLVDICRILDELAPIALAQSWDNVGLLAGDRTADVRRALLCIDLMPAVVAEAVRQKVQLVVAYHPPIFKPVQRLVRPSGEPADALFQCIRAGIAVYSTHTALDAAEGGTNDVIADLCGLSGTKPIEYAESGREECKLVVFVPQPNVDEVAGEIFQAGAGHIGEYDMCSFRISGDGTFRGSDASNPVVGRKGRFEQVNEIRMEAVVPGNCLPDVVAALRRAHPYEEPAFDIYPLRTPPRRGIGRVGRWSKPITLSTLARRLKKTASLPFVQLVGDPQTSVTRAIICVGSAGSLPFKVGLAPGDVIITGEIRHHDALATLRNGACAMALSHWASERPVLAPFAKRLSGRLPELDVRISHADHDPFTLI